MELRHKILKGILKACNEFDIMEILHHFIDYSLGYCCNHCNICKYDELTEFNKLSYNNFVLFNVHLLQYEHINIDEFKDIIDTLNKRVNFNIKI